MVMSAVQQVKALTRDELVAMLERGGSIQSVLTQMGIAVSHARARDQVVKQIDAFGIDRASYAKHNVPSDLISIVQQSLCWSDVVRGLGRGPYGGNIATVKKWCADLNIDTSHFNVTAAQQRCLVRHDYDSVLDVGCTLHRSSVRRYVKTNELLEYVCSRCNIAEWHGEELTLQLDHINGDSTDARLENLRWLCPNCHSLTPTFGSKNRVK